MTCNEPHCNCNSEKRCSWSQSYGEGSSYSGFFAKDKVYFGDQFGDRDDDFEYTFGCVEKETKYFYTQKADGILGLMKTHYKNVGKPIYEAMHQAEIIDNQTFALCLGKNGGAFQIGYHNDTLHLDKEISWIPLKKTHDFKVAVKGISLNNITIPNTHQYNTGFIDSGTTFTYLPKQLFKDLEKAFHVFCSLSEKHCLGNQSKLCFHYSEHEFP